ncbi:MAG: N-acyl-D-glucosamine 2-epimerase, partial [Lentisphaeria bacterium]|nr:N-acyl-D-glucosamine 2-epimerase [Lentisphaeria bacterium]
WSLPETTRAGAQLLRLYPGIQTAAIAGRTGEAMQAFMQGFLQKNGFGCQTRDAEGKIIQVIPAVSDADPGYHTNLSLMDVL